MPIYDHAFVDKMLSFSSASYTRYLLLVDFLHTMHLAESCIQLIKRYGSVQLAQNRKYPNRQAQAMESVNPILLQKALLTQQAPMLIKTCYMYTSMLVLLIPSWNIYSVSTWKFCSTPIGLKFNGFKILNISMMKGFFL